MLDDMDDEDWREAAEFEALEPLNPHLARVLALIASLLFNANKKEDAEPWTPETIFPWLAEPKPVLTPQEEEERAAKRLRRMQWEAKIAAWKTGNVFMPSVRPPEG